LKVWQEAMSVAERTYRLTSVLPQRRGLRHDKPDSPSCGSIAANIAEGHGRENSGSFIQFLRISQGSLKELETHLLLAARVGLVTTEEIEAVLRQCDELGGMLRGLIRSIQSRQSND